MEFSITKNPNAELEWFEFWMKNNYPNFEGVSSRDEDNYISVYMSSFTQQEYTAIAAYYSGLTSSETITNKHCRIYTYLPEGLNISRDKTEPPCHVDYTVQTTTRLQPIVTNVYKGEVREITYFAETVINPDSTISGSIPVVRETVSYTRDVAKMAISRSLKIYWYLNDGTQYSTYKERLKYYSPQEKIVEGQRLRANIIDFMQPYVLGMIMATEQVAYNDAVTLGAQLFQTYAANISSWIAASRGNDLITLVQNDTVVLWLNNYIDGNGTTIRMFIMNELNY